MCVHWCCKSCPNTLTKLPHCWAREHCNKYFIARSQNPHVTACPTGPWHLRRAYHRHPHRGPQTCDDCKRAVRRDKKLARSVRQKSDGALSRGPKYPGVVFLGELEVPEGFGGNTVGLVAQGKADRMRESCEDFSEKDEYLESYKLQRVWVSRFASFDGVEVSGGGWTLPGKRAETFGRRMGGNGHEQINTVLGREVHGSAHPKIHLDTLSPGTHVFIQYNPISATKKANNTSTREPACPSAHTTNQTISSTHPITDKDAIANTDHTQTLTSEIASSHSKSAHHHQLRYNIRSATGNKTQRDRATTVEAKEASRDSDRGIECKSNVNSNTRSLSSQAINMRPWDL